MGLPEKLKDLRTSHGLTQEEFGRIAGVSNAAVSTWEAGEKEPRMGSIKKLMAYFHVSLSDILGEEHEGALDLSSFLPRQGARIPVLGNVAAGIPIEAVEDILDYEEITPELAATGDFFALKIKGDSMAPRMLDGDVVIIRQQDDADSGDVAVVLVNGDAATVKKIRKQADGLSLIPINPTYDVMFYTPEQCRQLPVRIIGKVIELRGKL